jgi:hypothetical protein
MTVAKAKRQVTKLVGGVTSKPFNLQDAKRKAIAYQFGSTKNIKKQINSQPNLAVANLKDKVDEQRKDGLNGLIDVKVVAAETAIGIGIESGYYKQPVDLVENAVVFGGANILYNKFEKMGVYNGLGLDKKVACQVFSTALSVLIKMAYNKRSFNVDYLVICAAPVIVVENLNL